MTNKHVTGKLLIAGVGNIFLGDDGFGVEVVRRLRGGEPGTIYVIEPDRTSVPADTDGTLAGNPMFNAHGMQPDVVLGMLGLLDAADRRVLVVGCEPASVDYGIGLSEPVAAAVDNAVLAVLDLVAGAAGSDEHLLAAKE